MALTPLEADHIKQATAAWQMANKMADLNRPEWLEFWIEIYNAKLKDAGKCRAYFPSSKTRRAGPDSSAST